MMELKKAEQPEQNLRQSPEALADIIATAMNAIIAVDGAQRIVLFHAAAESTFRCQADEAMGSSVERFIPQRFRAGHRTRLRQFDQSGVTNRNLGGLDTLWALRATGEEFPTEASISKVESGGKKHFTVVIRDVTERIRFEEAVRRSEERFRLAAVGEAPADYRYGRGHHRTSPHRRGSAGKRTTFSVGCRHRACTDVDVRRG